MVEVWKDIRGYEKMYQVSSFGQVRSCDRTIYDRIRKHHRILKGKVLKLCEADKKRDFYYRVSLSKNGKWRSFDVHRLVAETFILNPQNKPQVNHVDGNKRNNHITNLEWVTSRENKMHAINIGLDIPNYGIRKVVRVNDGKLFNSLSEAARYIGVDSSTISKVCRGEYRHTKGMVFRYA